MSPKYRILSFHYISNNGAFLFTYSLWKLFQNEFPDVDVKVLDYKSPRLVLFEFIKRFKVFQSIPFFYLRRSKLLNNTYKQNLDVDIDYPHFASEKNIQQYLSKHFDAMIVGMDVWCITKGTERPLFPNIYWLPEKMDIPKIAYGVSGYNSNISLIQKNKVEISKYLNSFDIIGSRDRFTHDFVTRHRTRSSGLVEMVPDPTFLHKIQPTGVQDKLSRLGIDFKRPILGLLLFGNDKLSWEIKSHFKSKGYQIIAMSMYNPFADINLGHVLNPYEWAETFRLLSFCITDRFHGTIFCLKNQTPFISIEKDTGLPKSQSKIYDLLSEFNLTCCYVNPQADDFETSKFLQDANEIEVNWEESFKPNITSKIIEIQNHHLDFIKKIKLELNR